jgi:mevalonate kinase
MVTASAPGKIILLGEHSVVYSRPAIAVPVFEVGASAQVEDAPPGSGLTLVAPDVGRTLTLEGAAQDDPLAVIVRLAVAHLERSAPDAVITVTSTIPIAGGMGSGAAVSTAIVRALGGFFGEQIEQDEMSRLVYEVEKLYHGTPSGIDNTVVVSERPIYFIRDTIAEPFSVGRPINLLIADSGIPSQTRGVVEQVRDAWKAEPVHYDFVFDQIGELTDQGRLAMERGDLDSLGPLMDENHELLAQIGVSCPQLDELVESARFAGALGAKLSGAGRGGNLIALVEEIDVEQVKEALLEAGANRVIATVVE